MKKPASILLALVIAATPMYSLAENKPKILCSIFPIYDWMREILGERQSEVELSLLQKTGADMHNFQPTAEDFIKISSADLFIYIGGTSDLWADDAVPEAKNKSQVALKLTDAMRDALLEHEHEHEHAHEDEHGHDEHEHHDHTDEHIWLSLKNAKVLCKAMLEALIKVDGEYADTYTANCNAYIEKLDKLDKEYEAVVKNAKRDTLLFADRFPFAYLVKDYGLKHYAAFEGCSAESEASFETVAFLAEKADELSLPCLIVIEGSEGKIASAVLNASKNPNIPLLVLDSMQAMDKQAAKSGTNYLSIMEENLNIIKQALN